MQEKIQELQTEYMKLIAEYGDRKFRIVRETKACEEIEKKLHALDAQYLEISKEKEEKAE